MGMDLALSGGNLIITLICLLISCAAAKYATKDSVVNKAVLYCTRGFVSCFLSSAIIVFGAYSGLSINILVLIELSLLLLALCFFIAFATQLLLGTKPDFSIILLVFVCGLTVIITFLFFAPDGHMIDKIRNLFPFAGFCYLAVAFWSKSSKAIFAYTLAAITSTYVSILYILDLLSIAIYEPWWTPSLVYVLMSLSFLMMRSNDLLNKLQEADKNLKRNNEKFKEIINHSPFPIIISRLSDDKMLMANENAMSLFGIYKEDVERYRLKDIFADQQARKDLSERLENTGSVKDFEFLSDTQTAFSPFWLLSSASIIEYDMSPALYMALQDITLRKNKEFMLQDQATRDPLTGIFNRRYFEEEVSKKMHEAQKNNQPYAILMLDADHFKNVNDTYGHKTGDKVLTELARISDKALRDSDIVARYGGEEFVMFLSDTDEEQAIIVANRLRESIAKLVVKSDDNRDVTFTVSVGLCSSSFDANLPNLVKYADLALYQAKQNGRNRVEAYVTDFNTDAHKVVDKAAKHSHPIYEKEQEEEAEISLLDENIITDKEAQDDM